jgi:hypothetical protein
MGVDYISIPLRIFYERQELLGAYSILMFVM